MKLVSMKRVAIRGALYLQDIMHIGGPSWVFGVVAGFQKRL